jgi:hypothetical protein
MNFRSVVMFGRATPVDDPAAKCAALRVISEHVVPGRWEEVRPPSARELAATAVLEVPIEEASAKIRTGPPRDDLEDLSLPVWAGVLPLETIPGEPVPDEAGGPADVPLHVLAWPRGR